MIKRLVSFIVIASFCQAAYASQTRQYLKDLEQQTQPQDGFGSLSIGHNLSANNRTLEQGQVSLGTLYTGIGITDRLSIATSPFVYSEYDMVNFLARYSTPISQKEKLGFDVAYFKTQGAGQAVFTCRYIYQPNSCTPELRHTAFKMEAISAKLTYNRRAFSFYRFNSTLSYFHYFDDTMPFSFRMDPANGDNFSINLTTLHEFKVQDRTFLNIEAGFWGMNYQYPYYHLGASANIQIVNILIGAGLSSTFSPSFPRALARQFASYDSRFSIHPEIELQMFF